MANLSPVEILVHQACKTGDITQMKNIFIKIMNSKDDQGKTPLEHAVVNGDSSMVDFAIANGGKVNVQIEDGWTPLHCAANLGHAEVAKCLIENGAVVDVVTNKNSSTPLYIASQNGHLETEKSFCTRNDAISNRVIMCMNQIIHILVRFEN